MLSKVLSECQGRVNDDDSEICSLLHNDLGVQLPLHISLSRPVVLTTDQKQSFIEEFQHNVESSHTQP